MIGRVKPILNVLTRDDHRTYRAHYCGICLATKRTYGRRAAMGHSSEMVLISLLLEGLAPEDYHTEKAGCTVLPILPRKITVGPERHSLAVAAGVLASLQLDLKDARDDGERRIKRFLCRPHANMSGSINPNSAYELDFVKNATAKLPIDPVGDVVAGVIGSVFQLAGFGEEIVSVGCQIGHTLGRLMNLSDAIEDYEADMRANRENILQPKPNRRSGQSSNHHTAAIAHPPADELDDELTSVIDELALLIEKLPLQKNRELIDQIVNVHARARARKTVEHYRERVENMTPVRTIHPDKARTEPEAVSDLEQQTDFKHDPQPVS
ncbi:MAG: DUF5685 family protein [Planctomycetaceae bacterium]